MEHDDLPAHVGIGGCRGQRAFHPARLTLENARDVVAISRPGIEHDDMNAPKPKIEVIDSGVMGLWECEGIPEVGVLHELASPVEAARVVEVVARGCAPVVVPGA